MMLAPHFKNKQLIVGVGSALVDILARENDEFLQKTGAIKGGMIYVDSEFIEQTIASASQAPTIVPGGSACNTAIGVAKLGGQARFVGKRGQDKMGALFETDLIRNHVEPVLFKSPSPTGRVLSIITPDAQRSMFTFLGASAETLPAEMTPACFTGAAIVHIEGYLLFNADLIQAALTAAKAAGALVSLDLASFTVVEESKSLLIPIVKDFVDILIANEDEARAYTGHGDEIQALNALAQDTFIAALKIGEQGSLIAHDNHIFQIPPQATSCAVDSTGAGDLWAAGFLFGLVNGYSLQKSGELGSACGCEVCRVVGASIPEEGWQRIHKLLEE